MAPPFRRGAVSSPGFDSENPQGQIPYLEPRSEADQREINRMLAERRDALSAREMAEAKAVDILHHMQPKEVGKFKVPKNNTYAVHKRIASRHDIDFSPHDYPMFDGVIAKAFDVEAFNNPKHRDYEKFNGLRKNIAVLRNIILAHYFSDGRFDEVDAQDVFEREQLPSIAREIGVALRRDSSLRLPFSTYIDNNLANTPDIGAMEMYKMLLKLQNERTLFHPLAWAWDQKNFPWKLPEIEDSAFATFEQDIKKDLLNNKAVHMAQLDFEIDKLVTGYADINTLSPEQKAASIEEGRKILENLRIRLGQEEQDPGLLLNSDHQLAVMQDTGQLIQAYLILKSNTPSVEGDTATRYADDAMHKLDYILKIRTADILEQEGMKEEAERVRHTALKLMPPQWQDVSKHRFSDLVSIMELGMHSASQLKSGKSQALQQAMSGVADVSKKMSGARTEITGANNPAVTEQILALQKKLQQEQQLSSQPSQEKQPQLKL